MVLVTYDPEVKALYVKFTDQQNIRIAKTISVDQGTHLDLSEDNVPIGMEFIFPESMSQEAINALMEPKGSQIELLLNTARKLRASPDS